MSSPLLRKTNASKCTTRRPLLHLPLYIASHDQCNSSRLKPLSVNRCQNHTDLSPPPPIGHKSGPQSKPLGSKVVPERPLGSPKATLKGSRATKMSPKVVHGSFLGHCVASCAERRGIQRPGFWSKAVSFDRGASFQAGFWSACVTFETPLPRNRC